jgi:hypothetical protein
MPASADAGCVVPGADRTPLAGGFEIAIEPALTG